MPEDSGQASDELCASAVQESAGCWTCEAVTLSLCWVCGHSDCDRLQLLQAAQSGSADVSSGMPDAAPLQDWLGKPGRPLRPDAVEQTPESLAAICSFLQHQRGLPPEAESAQVLASAVLSADPPEESNALPQSRLFSAPACMTVSRATALSICMEGRTSPWLTCRAG